VARGFGPTTVDGLFSPARMRNGSGMRLGGRGIRLELSDGLELVVISPVSVTVAVRAAPQFTLPIAVSLAKFY
jgi:hypothetical protein